MMKNRTRSSKSLANQVALWNRLNYCQLYIWLCSSLPFFWLKIQNKPSIIPWNSSWIILLLALLRQSFPASLTETQPPFAKNKPKIKQPTYLFLVDGLLYFRCIVSLMLPITGLETYWSFGISWGGLSFPLFHNIAFCSKTLFFHWPKKAFYFVRNVIQTRGINLLDPQFDKNAQETDGWLTE